ncbi:hypothetical protein LY76DRAFT_685060, partial [Colletotrichum caudatum]
MTQSPALDAPRSWPQQRRRAAARSSCKTGTTSRAVGRTKRGEGRGRGFCAVGAAGVYAMRCQTMRTICVADRRRISTDPIRRRRRTLQQVIPDERG